VAVVPTAGAISAPVGRKPRLAPGSQFLSVIEGKEYPVRDGDIMHFRFNV